MQLSSVTLQRIAPPDVLMQLSSSGPDTLQALVLILHDSEQPFVDRRPVAWQPQGRCDP